MSPRTKIAISFFLFFSTFFAVWTLRATIFYAVDESIASPTLKAAYATAVKFCLWVLPAAGFAYWLRESNPARYLGLKTFPTSRQWMACLVVTSIFLLGIVTLELALNGRIISLAGLSSVLTVIGLLFFFVSPLLEEIFFRGLVMRECMSILPPTFANVLASALFAGIHLPYWLSHEGFTQAVTMNIAGVFIFSLVAGWLYIKSNSVWPPVFAHIANNVLVSLLVVRN